MRRTLSLLAAILGGCDRPQLPCPDGSGTCDPEPPSVEAAATPTGAPLWSRHFGAEGYDRALCVVFARNGDVLVTGVFEGSVDFGGGALASAGKHDVYLA